jgi:site-specific recombinase XerD
MPTNIITLTEIENSRLDNMLYNIIQGLTFNLPMRNAFIQLSYLTGMRTIEMFELSRWHNIDPYYFMVQTAKGGNMRVINKILVPPIILQEYNNGKEITDYTMSMYNYDIKQVLPKLFFGDKLSNHTTHCMRYNYIKKNVEQLGKFEEVQTLVGHRDVTNTQGYYYARTYSDNPQILNMFNPEFIWEPSF